MRTRHNGNGARGSNRGLVFLALLLAVAVAACVPPPPVHEIPPPVGTGISPAWGSLPPSAIVRIANEPSSPTALRPSPPNSDEYDSLNCDSFLPAAQSIPSGANPTLFKYTLATDGTVHDVLLERSSGNATLDKAALACANGAHRQEAIAAGTRMQIRWIGGILWSRPWHGFFDPKPDGSLAATCSITYPRDAIRLHQQGDAIVGFRIDDQGNTKDETIVRSSGSSVLDEASRRCVHAFRYFPARQVELPVQLDKSARIEWRLIGS